MTTETVFRGGDTHYLNVEELIKDQMADPVIIAMDALEDALAEEIERDVVPNIQILTDYRGISNNFYQFKYETIPSLVKSLAPYSSLQNEDLKHFINTSFYHLISYIYAFSPLYINPTDTPKTPAEKMIGNLYTNNWWNIDNHRLAFLDTSSFIDEDEFRNDNRTYPLHILDPSTGRIYILEVFTNGNDPVSIISDYVTTLLQAENLSLAIKEAKTGLEDPSCIKSAYAITDFAKLSQRTGAVTVIPVIKPTESTP